MSNKENKGKDIKISWYLTAGIQRSCLSYFFALYIFTGKWYLCFIKAIWISYLFPSNHNPYVISQQVVLKNDWPLLHPRIKSGSRWTVKNQGTHLQAGFRNKYRKLVEHEDMEVEVPERVELQKELGASQEHSRSLTRVSARAWEGPCAGYRSH